jgi:anti-sigma factor RsiW
MTCDEVKPLLDARVDDEIDPIRRTEVDAHVDSCPSCATELEKIQSVRDTVRAEMPYYKAPMDLQNRVRHALRGAGYLDKKAQRTSWRVWGAVAATLTFCVLGAAPFFVNARNQRQLVAEELLSAHERALIGRSVDVVSSDQHTVKPWFNGKLPFSPPVIDLALDGFPLKGGRVDYAGSRPIAALVYGRRLHEIDVFVWPSAGETPPPSRFERNGYNEITWEKDNFLFAAVSDLNDAELMAFANLLRSR